jgi:fluoroquinolone transport system permease protein
MMLYTKSKIMLYSFGQLLSQITKDAMLYMACFAPVIMGVFNRYGIPYAENILTRQFNRIEILRPYYLLFDLFLAVMTPLMFCFISAMVLLGEIDDKISSYMAVTPLGKNGYLISRLGIPSVISLMVTLISLNIFPLTKLTTGMITGISILASFSGFIVSLMVVALSTNKVEGMAVTKLTGIFSLGIPAPFLITGKIQYILSFLPSFWMAKFAISKNLLHLLLGLIISVIWILFLWKKFKRKLQ